MPSDAAAPGGYRVVGNQVVDASGKAHLFHGVDRPSLEFNANGDHLALSDYALMATWKANVVRIALNQGFWLQGSAEYSAGYAALVEQQVQWAESKGLDVILDLHWSDQGNLAMKGAQQCMADTNSVTFWQQVAARFKGDGRVLFELYNEPHDITWAVWYGGGTACNFTIVGMQKLYDTVRATGAENIVVVGGIDYAYQLSGVAAFPIVGNNVMYATHPYNQGAYKQPSDFDASFGNIAKQYPVIITEFGDQSPACQTSYYGAVIQYADAHALSWTGWAWYAADCKFPALISDWSATPTAAGQIEKAALLSY